MTKCGNSPPNRNVTAYTPQNTKLMTRRGFARSSRLKTANDANIRPATT